MAQQHGKVILHRSTPRHKLRRMRICVYGAGAIGGHLAARLARAGMTVSVVARGAHLAAMQRDGLRVRAADGELHARVVASDDPAALGAQDAVIVTVKAPALPAVAAGIAPLLLPDTPVVFAMNGIPWWYHHAVGGAAEGTRLALLDPGDALWSAVGPRRAIGGVVYSSCTVVAPGVIEAINQVNRLVLGEPDGTLSPRLAAIAAPLRAGGLVVEETPRIRDAVWAKLLLNLSSGPLSVLTQAPGTALAREPACEAAGQSVMAEAAAIAAAMGCAVPPLPAERFAGGGSPHLPSIAQDLALGRKMEIDALHTVPLAMARAAGVATPMLDLLAALVRVRARQAGLYT
jgi:2-dehydropantoate 2-reductase